MKAYDLIQVLWVEDDPSVRETYPLKADNFDLQLEPYSCWDDARMALENDYDRWSAIILDAKCKYHRDDNDNAVRFLAAALKDIAVISKEKRRVIPWYVLTGGDESEVSDSITDDRMKWDGDWTNSTNKKFYSKNVDNEVLFRRIRYHAKRSPRIQIQEMYRDYYEKLAQLNIDVCEDILTILEAMHFPDSHPDFNPRYFYNPLRKALEYIFRAAREVDVLPDVFFNGGKVNLNQCFMFAIGKDAEKLGYKHGDGGFTPIHIQNMMSLIINLGNSNSHSFNSSHSTELTEKEVLSYANHIKAIGGNSKLLIFSIALQFCEILQWMNNFIKDHPDKEENRKRWELIGENRNCPTGIIEKRDGFFHIGEDYSALLQNDDLLGKKVQILNSIPNTNPRTKKYKFFVRESDLKVIDDADKGPM